MALIYFQKRKDNIFIKLSVKDGEFAYPVKANKTRLDTFLKSLPNGSRLEVFISASNDKGTLKEYAE